MGIYDLTVPASAFCLARFIFGLNSHIRAVAVAASKFRIKDFHWRSDRSAIADRQIAEQTGEQWRSHVAQWARGIDMSDDSRQAV